MSFPLMKEYQDFAATVTKATRIAAVVTGLTLLGIYIYGLHIRLEAVQAEVNDYQYEITQLNEEHANYLSELEALYKVACAAAGPTN